MRRDALPPRAARAVPAALALAYVVLFALALYLRLRDPLSSRVIGAEDPYWHMVVVKEFAERGFIGEYETIGGGFYPPGLHGLVVILWTSTGVGLYDLARFLPPLIGAVAVLAVAALLHEEAGPWAGLAGGLVAATLPEHIFRTTLLFPTALDLLLLPALLLFLARLTRGDAWSAFPFTLLLVVLAVTHVWAVLLFAPVVLSFVALRVAFPPRPGPPRLAHAASAAALTVLVTVGAYRYWEGTRAGTLSQFVPDWRALVPRLAGAIGVAPGTLVVAAAVLALVGLSAVAAERLLRARPRERAAVALAVGIGATGGGVALFWALTARELPLHVDYAAMFGAPALLLAAGGLFVLATGRSAAADLGLVTCAVTLPITAIDLTGHWALPHRTAVFLGLGIVLLAGAAVGGAVDAVSRGVSWSASASSSPAPARAAPAAASGRATALPGGAHGDGPAPPLARHAVPVAGVLALAILLAAALPVGQGSYSWYRYYSEDEFGLLEAARDALAAEPDAVVVVGAWQPNLHLRAIGDHRRVEWVPEAFTDDAAQRDAALAPLLASHPTVFVLVDAHTREAQGLEDAWTLEGETVWSCCGGSHVLVRVPAETVDVRS